ncbi:MAG: cation-translocating P-type ATPase [Candidatus Berkelbacteria bacterium]
MAYNNQKLEGLTSAEVEKLTLEYGKNILVPEKKETFFHKILHVLSEPMFILLIVAALIYFILGEPRDGAIMLVFVLAIISIEVIQEWKTDQTLKALKDLSAPQIKVIRDGIEITIHSENLVPGDLMIISEGTKIPADGLVVKASDLCVDESSLTGEAEGVWKIVTDKIEPNNDVWRKDYCYAGTLAINGSAYISVEKTGSATEYGKIGSDVAAAPDEPTPLQNQVGKLVKLSAGIAGVLFALVSAITYFHLPDHVFRARIIESILSGITLAMAMIPEEFPVILTVFLSMGAWRLAKKQSIVHRLPSVETLGAISVLCVDKTGTITMNKMKVEDTWALDADTKALAHTLGLGCEIEAYDPMEKAMHDHCESLGLSRGHLYSGELLYEYPFTSENKMMGHVWHHDEKIIIAAKGSPESIFELCEIPAHHKKAAEKKLLEMSLLGLRVIAVAKMELKDQKSIPKDLSDCKLKLCGLIGLADPPRASVKSDIAQCISAGIRVVMITGDSAVTASSIARQIGMPFSDHIIMGDDLNNMSDEALQERVKDVSIFARVIPEHKMRIVRAFKANGEIVAMTGDGVNDAPALKYADIGIAMGMRGSEVSREAADLILMDDNFSTIVTTIRDGRRIYDNIRKAIGYVFTIHIPIALASLLAPLLGIVPAAAMLLPLHIVLLELVIDPTCSIVLERQHAEPDIMKRKPRNPKEQIITAGMLVKSFTQGLVVFAASFGTYLYFLHQNAENAPLARGLGLSVILLANIMLVHVSSSNTISAARTFSNLAKDKVMAAVTIATVIGLLVILYSPLNHFLKIAAPTVWQLLLVVFIAFISVFWYEFVKYGKRLRLRKVA